MRKDKILIGVLLIALISNVRLLSQENLQKLFNQLKPSNQKLISGNYQSTPNSGYSPHLAQLFEFEKEYKSFYPDLHSKHSISRIGAYPDTLIVGVAPYDSLTITGTLTHNGPIFVVLNGKLTIKNATLTNLGDLVVFNNGMVSIDSSDISYPQEYFYQLSLILVNHAEVTISNSTISYGGFSYNCLVADTATLSYNNVTQPDWTTTGMNNMSAINISGTNQAGEFIIMDYVTLNIKNASTALFWHQFPDTAVINYSFGEHDTAYNYHFNNSIAGIQGIEYNINADSVYDVMWGMMPCSNSNVNITDSKIRSIGLWFTIPNDSVLVSGITDNASYSSFTAPLSDHTLTLNNSTVQTWSFYTFYNDIINVSGCIAGEIGTENSSKMYGNDYVVDGSGGYHWSSDTSSIIANQATVYADVRSEMNSIFVFGYGSVTGSGIAEAIDNSLLIVVQSAVPATPSVVSGGAAWFDNINQPGNIFADSVAPISGSALINRGPTSNWMYFKNWQLFYRSVDSVTLIPITGIDTLPVSDNLLTDWNTHGITSGTYYLDLRLSDTWGNEVDAVMQVTLLPLILGIDQLTSSSQFTIFPNPANNQLSVIMDDPLNQDGILTITDLTGRQVFSQRVFSSQLQFKVDISFLAPSIYFLKLQTSQGVMVKKFIKE